MTEGEVIEIIDCGENLWFNCRQINDERAILVKKTAKARTVIEGDTVRWEREKAYWTPRGWPQSGRPGIDFDIELTKIGGSGCDRPIIKAK